MSPRQLRGHVLERHAGREPLKKCFKTWTAPQNRGLQNEFRRKLREVGSSGLFGAISQMA